MSEHLAVGTHGREGFTLARNADALYRVVRGGGRRLPDDLRRIKLYESDNHWRNFLDCVKTRQPTITPVETAHHSAIPGHLGLIAMLVGRKIRWDAAREIIIDDAEASQLLTRTYRAPWKLA